MREKGFKVVLTGEGSDEHFAGYSFFITDYLRETDTTFDGDVVNDRLAKLQAVESTSGLFDETGNTKMSYTDATVSRSMLNGISTHRFLTTGIGLPRDMFTDAVLQRTSDPDPCFAMAAALNGIARFKAKTKWHSLHTALYIESHTILPNILCNHLGDRSEMARSVEARVPFLDHPLIEYVNQLPP